MIGKITMAMFHLSTKPIKRSSGRSATASAAYRAGCKIKDERTGLSHDYSKKKGIVKTDCFVFMGDQKVLLKRSELWNLAERSEKRKDGRTAREIIVSLPHELSAGSRQILVEKFTESISKKYGVAIDFAIHEPDEQGDQRNHHCHIMMTTRSVDLSRGVFELGKKTQLELSNTKLKELDLPKTQDQIKALRKEWADMTNHHLDIANIKKRIDHRSYEEQGILLKPTIKLGWKATELERLGVDTVKGDINRQIRGDNWGIVLNTVWANNLNNELIASREQPQPQPKTKIKTDIPDIELSSFSKMMFEGLHKEHDDIINLDADIESDIYENKYQSWLYNLDELGRLLDGELDSAKHSIKGLDDIKTALGSVEQLVVNLDDAVKNPDDETTKIKDSAIDWLAADIEKCNLFIEQVNEPQAAPVAAPASWRMP